MPEKNQKPNVIPTTEQINAANERARIAAFEAEKLAATNDIYQASISPEDTPINHVNAVEMMRRRTDEQLKQQVKGGDIKYELNEILDTKTPSINSKTEEQMRLRDEQLTKNLIQTQNFQKQTEEASKRFLPKTEIINTNMNTKNPVPTLAVESVGSNPSNIDPYIMELNQPNYNAPFDVIPLPSKGKIYKNKKANIRVGFMTTADENILTSPNLLQSGEFLEILINRKVLEPELRYKDLHPGDRNAIMIWLRATGYGEVYPVTLLDEKNVPFDTDINLNDLKTKELGAEPDNEGLFIFQFPLSKSIIKFKLLTCGDVDAIEKQIELEREQGNPIDNTSVYAIEKAIIELDGFRDREVIKNFSSSMRIQDGKAFNDYIEEIESGVDLDIKVGTPGGGSISTFLPLNVKFFWPNFRV